MRLEITLLRSEYCRTTVFPKLIPPPLLLPLLSLVVSNANGFIVHHSPPILCEQGFQQPHAKVRTSLYAEEQQATIETYSFRDWNLTYRRKTQSSRREQKKDSGVASLRRPVQTLDQSAMATVILIHPVGIGMNSWFWTKLITLHCMGGSQRSIVRYYCSRFDWMWNRQWQ